MSAHKYFTFEPCPGYSIQACYTETTVLALLSLLQFDLIKIHVVLFTSMAQNFWGATDFSMAVPQKSNPMHYRAYRAFFPNLTNKYQLHKSKVEGKLPYRLTHS